MAAVVSTSVCFGGLMGVSVTNLYFHMKKKIADKSGQEPAVVHQEPLHWRKEHYRPGLGDVLTRVNHIALIVRDVGYSCSFYTQIIGFQQIGRPNFDRHGVWLTMGNIELHLIKGVPVTEKGQHPADLIVPHISIETTDVKSVRSRLTDMKAKYPHLYWRQNVSVPTAEASKEARFESDHTSDDGKIIQFFVEDPDGNWLEFCNCDELTESCLGTQAPYAPRYSPDCLGIQVQARADMYIRVKRWIRRARTSIQQQRRADFKHKSFAISPVLEDQVDMAKLDNFAARINTYGDICQSFSIDELQSLLADAGNNVPTAVLMMRQKVLQSGHMMLPPSYLVDSTHLQKCRPLRTSATCPNLGDFADDFPDAALARSQVLSK